MTPLPAVCFVEDVCEALRISRRTFERLQRHGAFPVSELPRLDRKKRFSGAAVTAFIESGGASGFNHARTVARPRMVRASNSVGGAR